MSGAGEALAAAAAAALAEVGGLNGAYDGPPLKAAFPYATIETGAERDWSHKNGEGRELRLAATVPDQGERPARVRALAAAVEAAIAGIGPELAGWRLVTCLFLRSRLARDGAAGWVAMVEYRARMLRE